MSDPAQDLFSRLLGYLRRPPSLGPTDQRPELFAARDHPDFAALHPGPFLLGISLPPIENEVEPAVFLTELNSTDPSKRKRVISLGRNRDNQVCLPVGMVSKLHATLTGDQGQWTVMDAGSANGVAVEGTILEPYEDHPIVDGCRIEIGGAVRCWFLDSPRVQALLRSLMSP